MSVQATASKLACILATVMVGVTGCASPTDDVTIDPLEDGVSTHQIPIDTGRPTGISFVYEGAPFIQVLATGDGLTTGSTFSRRTEYWSGS